MANKIKICSVPKLDMKSVTDYLGDSIESGHMTNFGPLYHLLCERLKVYLNLDSSKDIIVVSSGHVALMAAYAVLYVDNLACPAYTFPSTELAASLMKKKVIRCDVDPHTLCLSPESLDRSDISSAVVTCALSVIPDLEFMTRLTKVKRIKLIIDGAPVFGTRDIYNYGDAFCLSFHATKSLAGGEGGAIIIDKKYTSAVKEFINFGFGKTKNLFGLNGKISEIACAAILTQLDNFEAQRKARLKNSDFYRKELGPSSKIFIPRTEVEDTVYQVFPIFSNQNLNKKLEKQNIESLVYYKRQDLDDYKEEKFCISRKLYQQNVCLPCHADLSKTDLRKIVKTILE